MYYATSTTRHTDLARPFVAVAIALLLLVFTAACGKGSDGKSNIVGEVTAAEVPGGTSTAASATPTVPVVSPTVTYTEAESVYNAKRYAEATEMFAVIATRRPENAWGHYMHGLSAWKAGDRSRAEKAFATALERDSNHVKSHLNLARVLIEDGRTGEALPHVEKALVVDSGSADGYRLLGRVRGDLKEFDPAIDAYRKALVLNGKDTWSMNNMGYLFIRSGRFEEALGPLALATELNPGMAVFQNNLGMALERTFRYTQAVEAYGAAVAADSTYAKAVSSLERLKGRKDESWVTQADLKVLAQAFAGSIR